MPFMKQRGIMGVAIFTVNHAQQLTIFCSVGNVHGRGNN